MHEKRSGAELKNQASIHERSREATDSQNVAHVHLPKLYFSDSYACQPPTVNSFAAEKFRKLKYRITSVFRS